MMVLGLLVREVPAQSRTSESAPVCSRRFVVDLNDFAPLAFRANGQLQGLAHDVVSELKVKTGCQFQEVERSRPVAIDNMNRDRADISLLIVKSSEYEKGGEFVPFFKSYRELVVSKKVYHPGRPIEAYLADEKIKFAHIIGSRAAFAEKEAEILLKSNRLIATPAPEGSFRMLKESRVQALMYPSMVISHYVEKLGMEKDVARIADSSFDYPVGLYLSKRRVSSQEKAMIVKALAEMKKDGSFLRIFSKYMSREEAQRRLDSQI